MSTIVTPQSHSKHLLHWQSDDGLCASIAAAKLVVNVLQQIRHMPQYCHQVVPRQCPA
jgi:hypothetical protein